MKKITPIPGALILSRQHVYVGLYFIRTIPQDSIPGFFNLIILERGSIATYCLCDDETIHDVFDTEKGHTNDWVIRNVN